MDLYGAWCTKHTAETIKNRGIFSRKTYFLEEIPLFFMSKTSRGTPTLEVRWDWIFKASRSERISKVCSIGKIETVLGRKAKIMCKVYSVSNQKGDVSKTATCVNLGIGLAKVGKKVCLIDADAQGSLTESLGFRSTMNWTSPWEQSWEWSSTRRISRKTSGSFIIRRALISFREAGIGK